MKFIETKAHLDEYDKEQRAAGYTYKLWMETEDESGMRFRDIYYFKTKQEMDKFIKERLEKISKWGEYLSDMEIVDLKREMLV